MKTKHKRHAGRPPKPKAEKQSKRIGVRVTPGVFREISEDAKQAKQSRGAFLVECWRKLWEADK